MFIEQLKKKDFEDFAKIFHSSIFELKKEGEKVILTLYCCDLDDNPIVPFPTFVLTDFMLYTNQEYSAHQGYATNDWRTFLDGKLKELGIFDYGEKLKEYSQKEYEKWLLYKQEKPELPAEKASFVGRLKPAHFVKLAKRLGVYIERISCEFLPFEKCWKVNFIGENESEIFYFYDFSAEPEARNYSCINYVPFLNSAIVKTEYLNMMRKLFGDYEQAVDKNL